MPLGKTIAPAEGDRERFRSAPGNIARRLRRADPAIEIRLLDLQILLAMQSLSTEASGASIVDELHKNGRPIRWQSRVYVALDRLEREGLISRKLRDKKVLRPRGHRRSMIMLTSSGRLVLQRSLRIIDLLRRNEERAEAG